MSRRTFSAEATEAAPVRRPRGRRLVGSRPDGDPAAARKPLKSIGRHAAQHYDPVTGRKIDRRGRDGASA